MLVLIVLHFVAAALAPALIQIIDRKTFFVLALIPGAAFVWTLAQTPAVTGPGAGTITESTSWIPTLEFDIAFQLTTLSWLMSLLVTGIGALVLVYCAFYFRPKDPEIWRFSGVLTAFAGAMLGLVLADDLLLLYVFWEVTTVLSYLLIGHNPERQANRRAAMNALLVTTFGGLAMLAGMLLLGQSAGTYRISEILAAPPDGTVVTIAILLILVGAVSKSALVPFHFWLPGAMAAPTPVSAYLHAAAMVKAGVYLVALFAPTFATTPGWRLSLIIVGSWTMLIGGVRALRQYDVKLLLAYGTVSQLGFLIVMLGAGTRSAALAGIALVGAHALFKAALFLVVGIVDRSTHTRDLRVLSGLRTQMPGLFLVSVLAAASMAGLPPFIGFVAKESAFAAFEDLGADLGWPGVAWLPLALITLGSVLTVAYSVRFVWGIFGDKSDVPVCVPDQRARGFIVAPAVLAALGLGFGFLGAPATGLLLPYAEAYPAGAHEPTLSLWHGFELALGLSLLCIVLGVVLFGHRKRVARVHHRIAERFPIADAERIYYSIIRGLDRLAVEVTGRTQRGSLPVYLSVILIVVLLVPGYALVTNSSWGGVILFDSVSQVVTGFLMIVAAIITVRSRRRVRAVLLVGVTGYGTAILFILHGAPDLALTQVLVETVTLVIFVLAIRSLAPYFSDRPLTRTRWIRVSIGTAFGVFVSLFALAASGARTATPISEGFAEPAVEFGGGKNIVNVTLVDIRAWDTLGELAVLVVAATGVASLIYLITGRSAQFRPNDEQAAQPPLQGTGSPSTGSGVWLRAGRTLAPERRSIVFEVVTRLIFHTIIVFSIYLVFAGHSLPGGGFAGGLVAGLALMVRYLAGGRHELDEAAPIDAGVVLGLGLVLATLAGVVPLLSGETTLQSAVYDFSIPLLGDLHFVTSLFFDFGVYLVVIGLLLDILRSLGAGVDRDVEMAARQTSGN